MLITPTVRPADQNDLDAIVAIETAGWPSGEGMRAERSIFASRIECQFVWAACDADGTVLGMFTAFRPKWAHADRLDELLRDCSVELFDQPPWERWQGIGRNYGLARDWHESTAEGTLLHGAMHNSGGDVLFGVGLAIHEQYKGRGLARFLLQSVMNEARKTGVRYFLGYGRLPSFHRFPQLDIDTYLGMTESDSRGVRPHDPQLRFYWSIGAQPIRSVDDRYRYVAIPGSMRDDPESRGHGVLIVAPLGAPLFPVDRLSK